MEPRHHQPPGRGGGQALGGLWRAGCGSRCRSHRAALEGPAVTRPFDLMRRLRAGVASVLLLSATGSYALNTATIVVSVASPDCLEYRLVGISYWLYCTWTGCKVRTSIKVLPYNPVATRSKEPHVENEW